MIGAIQCAVSLGRICFNAAVMTLASFRADTIKGNLDRCKIVVSHSSKLKLDTIRIRTEEPDFSSAPDTPCDWEEHVYVKVK